MAVVGAFLVSAIVGGCNGGGGGSLGPYTEVHGKVTCKGKVVTVGTITFTPTFGANADGLEPTTRTAEIDENGTFEVEDTEELPEGLLPGDYKVTIEFDFAADGTKPDCAAVDIPYTAVADPERISNFDLK
jgi:hypothetical protein